MLVSGNIAELLYLNIVRKGSTAKPTFPPPDFFREYFLKKSGCHGSVPPDFFKKLSQALHGSGNVGLAVVPFLARFR